MPPGFDGGRRNAGIQEDGSGRSIGRPAEARSTSAAVSVLAPRADVVVFAVDGAERSADASNKRAAPAGTFRVVTSPLAAVASHLALRMDPKYRLHWGARGSALYPESTVPQVPLHRLIRPLRRRKLRKGELAEPCVLVELEDVEQRTGVVASADEAVVLGSDKLLFGEADVLTTRLRPNLGKTIRNDPTRRMAGTTEWIPLRVKTEQLHPTLLKHYLLSPGYVDHALGLLSGKEHPRVAEADVFALRVPVPDAAEQVRLVAAIHTLETQMTMARAALARPDAVIDEVIGREFGFDGAAYVAARGDPERARVFARPLRAGAASFVLRGSVTYHDPGFEPVATFWRRTPAVRLRSQVALPVRLGVTVTQAELQEGGDAYYVHPGATKHQDIVALEDCYRVGDEFYATHRRRFGLAPGDLIVNRSGEAVGKIALWDAALPALASDFTMRVRFGPQMHAQFAWYFMRSAPFQAQIRRERQGSSVPNIFPPQLGAMWLPLCSPERQAMIAQEIAQRLAGIAETKRHIDALLGNIQAGIQAAVTG